MRRLLDLLACVRCLVSGHQGVTETIGRQIRLRCDRCGRVSPGWILALLLACVSIGATPNPPAIQLTVSPRIGNAPGSIHAKVIIERDARNRALTIVVDGEHYAQGSTKDVDGDQAQRVWDLWWHDLPCGTYLVAVELLRPSAEDAVKPVRGEARLLGFECAEAEP